MQIIKNTRVPELAQRFSQLQLKKDHRQKILKTPKKQQQKMSTHMQTSLYICVTCFACAGLCNYQVAITAS